MRTAASFLAKGNIRNAVMFIVVVFPLLYLTIITRKTLVVEQSGVVGRSLRKNNATITDKRIAIFTIYQITSREGILPAYMNYLVESCGWQTAHVDCYLYVIVDDCHPFNKALSSALTPNYTDVRKAALFTCRNHSSDIESDRFPSNVIVTIWNYTYWASYLYRRTWVRAPGSIKVFNKQIDYKVLYGSLFEQEILTAYPFRPLYSHYGWMDPDIILGDINKFMRSWDYDIYTAYFPAGYQEGTLSGQLTTFRNTLPIRRLWKQLPFIYGKLNSSKEYGSDERVFGRYIFSPSVYKKYKFYHGDDGFHDYLFEHDSINPLQNGGGSMVYYERGKVLRTTGLCSPYVKHVEAVYFHMTVLKKRCFKDSLDPIANQCSAMAPYGAWKLPRWNISLDLHRRKCSFNDPQWFTYAEAPSKVTHPVNPETLAGICERENPVPTKPHSEGWLDKVRFRLGFF